ncbi:MAG: TlpA family protein disulfide reductase [Candidatus Firestonebacteria bacterium]|nr:TlpA family protein disulfide reductase [Candidatus Firestonebacteria bacterium]
MKICKSSNKKIAFLIFFILSFYLSSCNKTNDNANISSNEIPKTKKEEPAVNNTKKAPDFTLKNINNENITLSSFDGKVIILNFWATWCPPCRNEIPGFIELYNSYKDKNFVIIGVSLDNDGKAVLESFIKEHGINYPVLLGNNEVTRLYGGIRGIPTTFIINKNRDIVQSFIGFRDKAIFENEIKKLL